MKATAERAAAKTNRLPVAVAITIMLLLATAAAASYFFFAGRLPAPEMKTPDYPPMATGATGGNLAGNLTENLAAGGFMAEQEGWLYFANIADGGSLYMCREGGEKMVKLTDFPVANINILADSLVFTGIEKCLAARKGGVYEVKFDNLSDLMARIQFANGVSYGGRLYVIQGLHSGAEPRFSVIDSSNTYFSPWLDKNGLFAFSWRAAPVTADTVALDLLASGFTRLMAGEQTNAVPSEPIPDFYTPHTAGQSLLTNKMTAVTIPAGNDGESVVRQFVRQGTMYAELSSQSGSRVVRYDLKSLQPVDELKGQNLLQCDGSLVFTGNDGFIYEIGDGAVYPASAVASTEIAPGRDGGLILQTANGSCITVSKENRLQSLFDKLRLAASRVILKKHLVVNQNGWYNYFSPEISPAIAGLSVADSPGFFRAGNRYYYLGENGRWSENGELVEWLNRTPDLEPLSTPESYIGENRFKPAWMPAEAAKTPGGLDVTEDFGNETTPGASTAADASNDPRDALTVTVMLLRGEDLEVSGYSRESVGRISDYSGEAVEAEINAKTDAVLQFFASETGNAPDADEIRAMLEDWFYTAGYRIGGAEVNESGNVAQVTLATSNTVDAELLFTVMQKEIETRAKENPGMLLWSRERQMEWGIGVILEVMKDPQTYGATDAAEVETVILMKKDAKAGWVADDISAVSNCFVRGVN